MKIRTLIKGIPEKPRAYIRKLIYRIIYLGFNYHPNEGLSVLKRKMNWYFRFNPKLHEKYKREMTFLNEKSISSYSYSFIFPYDFTFNYNRKQIEVHKDDAKGLFYVMHNGRRLYYPKGCSEQDVQIKYCCISIEQDIDSPHRYIHNDSFKINPKAVVVDIGAAEGNFALDHIEQISHLYLFEADDEWINALEATFEPWKEKVTIINKYVSDTDSNKSVTLDTIFGDQIIHCIKIDVEGAEEKILSKALTVLQNPDLNLFICTYHQQKDADTFESLLKNMGFSCSFSDGYMLFIYRKLKPPYLRKGLIRAKKFSN